MHTNIKKHHAVFIIFLSLSLIFLKNQASASATKTSTKLSLMDGLRQINYETKMLKESRVEKYDKFQKDLDEFIDKGSSKIDSSNFLYVLNTPDFSAEEYDQGLAGTDLAGLGSAFKDAQDTYGVNAILLMAMAKHETGNGTSELFREKNNLFGFNAYDYDPYNQASTFKTPADSINTVAGHLAENYLNTDGPYYNGISTDGIGVDYATDPDWSKKVNWMMIEVSQNMIGAFANETAN